MPKVLVLGAINQDEVARVSRHPLPGETVVATGVATSPGGKGANQAAAAAASGVEVQLIGAVGDDRAGSHQLEALSQAGVDVSMVRRVMETATGRAFICVSDAGENSIVVMLGANAFVSPATLHGAATPDVVVGQTEVGAVPVEALGGFAAECGARLVINNAPVVPLSPRLLAAADPLIVNRHEAADMLRPDDAATADELDLVARLRRSTGARSVIVTLGADGCVIADAADVRRLPAVEADEVVDTTGAGDAFVGVLAASLARGRSLDASAIEASTAASAVVARHGARAVPGTMALTD
ncbi:ribokinase [Agromyces sp. CFH 90414]|uniref:Ribokinase n=1 Tax=Agromyces agglutinans TaxID=2662258 RepID=A0A6I2FFN6_9MICO|nr:ribokinase [Agromyces agglutinans]MRG60723.1 ribokinase [Agromyces agglutinans]